MLYLQEHVSCRNYEQGDRPSIEYYRAAKGETWKTRLNDNKIVFMMKGGGRVAFDQYDDRISKGMMILLPGGCDCRALAEEDTEFMVCRLKNNLQLCEHFSLEKLYNVSVEIEDKYRPLAINTPMEAYVNSLKEYITDNVRCLYFF
ncbi:MAG: hypothetical protein LUG51_16725 [Tannerellaceae bacterium]|nr:hypothetical protein [Tannerellaceae bacterium]